MAVSREAPDLQPLGGAGDLERFEFGLGVLFLQEWEELFEREHAGFHENAAPARQSGAAIRGSMAQWTQLQQSHIRLHEHGTPHSSMSSNGPSYPGGNQFRASLQTSPVSCPDSSKLTMPPKP